jgi:hypothetical protein
LDTNANISTSSIDFQQIAWVDDFKQLTRPYLQQTFFVTYDPFKRFFGRKKLIIALPSGFDLFFLQVVFPLLPSLDYLHLVETFLQ